MKKISIPKYFYIGEKDVIADKIDVKRMLELFDKNTLEVKIEFYLWSLDGVDWWLCSFRLFMGN